MPKFIIASAIVLITLTSCSSRCGASKWRCRRYVEIEKPQPQQKAQLPQTKSV